MSDAWKPFPRSWVSAGANSDAAPHAQQQQQLTLCTYNILNEHFVHLGGYEYCSPEMKSSAYRLARILTELTEFGADLVALQEVNYASMEASGAWERLKVMGYGHVTCPLDTRVNLLTLYRPDRLTVLETCSAFMHVLAADLAGFEAEALPELSAGGYPAQLTAFRLHSSSQVLVVANLHARWENFSRPSVKRLQLLAVLRAAVAMAARHGAAAAAGRSFPLALLGDFNSRPCDQPYAMLRGGCETAAHSDGDQDCSPACVRRFADAAEAAFAPPLRPQLASAYAAVVGTEPSSTSHCVDSGGESWGCLDYVWISEGLTPRGALLTPGLELVRDMPSELFPSDHLPIVVRVGL